MLRKQPIEHTTHLFKQNPNLRTIISFIVGFVFSLSHPSYAEKQEKQREHFIKAEKALKQRQFGFYQHIKHNLRDYPLYPYLEYDFLKQHLDQEHQSTIEHFLIEYHHTLLAESLRQSWIKRLSQQKRWHTLIKHIGSEPSTAMRCHYLDAQEHTGHQPPKEPIIRNLWLVAHEQPSDCDRLFKHWLNQGLISNNLIWDRFNMAMQQGHDPLARYLMTQLSTDARPMAELYLALNKDPLILIQQKSSLIAKPNAYKQDVITYGLKRLAIQDPSKALSMWRLFAKPYTFTSDQEKYIIEPLAHALMRKHPSQLKALLKMGTSKQANPVVLELLIRDNLSKENWALVRNYIQKMPSNLRSESIWQYWYARSLEQLGHKDHAVSLFQALLTSRDYYGFLSATQLKQPLAIQHIPIPITASEYQTIRSDPAIARVREWMLLGRTQWANREWMYFINHLDDRKKYTAARIANDNGWSHLALITTTRMKHQDDLELRFPRLFEPLIHAASDRHQLLPGLLFAMIRQESFFQTHAGSHAGAKGLMQLMPNTAKEMAKRIRIPEPKIYDLHSPALNIRLGSEYVHYLLNTFDSNLILAISAYNAGPYRVTQWLPNKTQAADVWIENIPFYETREYVKLVTTYMFIYQYLFGKVPDLSMILQPISPINH